MSAMINVPSSASVVDLLSEDCSLRVPAGVSTETLGVLESLGIKALSQIQREALPPALSGSDVIAKGRTGTGKTVAFLAPTVEALSRRARESPGAIRAVVLSHTRELASQVLTNALAQKQLEEPYRQVELGKVEAATYTRTPDRKQGGRVVA